MMQRRAFLKRLATWGGAAVGSLLAAAGLGWFIDRQHRAALSTPFKPVALLDELEAGAPKKVPVYDIPLGSWTLQPAQQIGEVWLIRREGDVVQACSVKCPHRGGTLRLGEEGFVCPSHGARFDRSGHRLETTADGKPNPSPRDMDSLKVQLAARTDGAGQVVTVHYQEFLPGVPTQQAIGK